MRQALSAHPGGGRGPLSRIDVDIARRAAGQLELTYALVGRIGGLRIPAPAAPERTDGLWRHTCLEAFLRPEAGGDGYLELNLSPSGQWAAYRFGGYRAGMAPIGEIPPPAIAVTAAPGALTVRAVLDLSAIPELSAGGAWRLGLAAVVEDAEGSISYWALAHPTGKPDFHHPDGFACRVAEGQSW